MIDRFSIPELIAKRTSQSSFHVVAEPNVRIEFRNMVVGEAMEPFTYGGSVVVTCFKGAFIVSADDEPVALPELSFAVIPSGAHTRVACEAAGTLQLVWAPAHAATTKDPRQ